MILTYIFTVIAVCCLFLSGLAYIDAWMHKKAKRRAESEYYFFLSVGFGGTAALFFVCGTISLLI